MSVCVVGEMGVRGELGWLRSRKKTLMMATIQANGMKKPAMKS